MKYNISPLVAFLLLMNSSSSNAELVITATESGNNVVVTASGSFNITSTGGSAPIGYVTDNLDPGAGHILMGNHGVDFFRWDTLSNIPLVGPASFGPGSAADASSSTWPDDPGIFLSEPVGILGLGGSLYLVYPFPYFSGTPISGTMTFSNQSLASLGMDIGTYIWRTDRSDPNLNDYVTLKVVAGGGAASGYSTWAVANGASNQPSEDTNNDGVANGVAYFMNATGLATNPGIVGGSVTWPNGAKIPKAEYGVGKQFVVQTSSDLQMWNDVPATGDSKLILTDYSAGPPVVEASVEYTLPTGAAKSFVRLKVTPK